MEETRSGATCLRAGLRFSLVMVALVGRFAAFFEAFFAGFVTDCLAGDLIGMGFFMGSAQSRLDIGSG
jgi:hypothetical protein